MGKIYFLFIICFFFAACASTDNFRKVKLISVYDGDTFKVNLPCKKEIFCKNILVRVKGIDTPEITTKNTCQKQKAKQAKSFTEKYLVNGKIVLENCQRDKYFRLLCDVFIIKEKEEINLAEELLLSGLAVQYKGKSKNNKE